MRLIDVDKLEADIEYWENHDDPKKPDYDTRDIEQVIGFQPIVEAIPIEWLKKKYEEADGMGMGIEDWSEKDCFGHVIKEWEKENGTNRQR